MLSAGIDSGLSSTKVVLFKKGEVCAQAVVLGGDESAEQMAERCFKMALLEAGEAREAIRYVVTTGQGRKYISFSNDVVPDFICLARGINKILASVQTVIDVGAQKSLAVKCPGGSVVATANNDKCAAGAGIYLEMVSKLLEVPLERLAEMSLMSAEMVEVDSTCAVFAESEIISLIHSKKKPEDILRGVCWGLAQRLYPLLLQVGFEKDVAMVGGVARNMGVRKALEEQLGCEILVPENPLTVTALGAAIIADER